MVTLLWLDLFKEVCYMAANTQKLISNFPHEGRTTTVLYCMCFLIVIYIYISANAVKKLQNIFCNPLTQIVLPCVSIHSVPSNILSPFTVTRQQLLPDDITVGKERHYNCLCHYFEKSTLWTILPANSFHPADSYCTLQVIGVNTRLQSSPSNFSPRTKLSTF